MPNQPRPYFDRSKAPSVRRAAYAKQFTEDVWRAMWKPAVASVKETFGTFEIICNDGSKIKKGKKRQR